MPASSATGSRSNAAIENARRVQDLRREFGSFADWLAAHHPPR